MLYTAEYYSYIWLFLAPVLGGYNITVVTAPREGPFRLRTSVTLSCQVNPQPSGRVTFSWKSSDQNSGLPSGNSTSSNTILRINYNHLHFGWYFCYVYSGGTLVGVGRTLVETEGQSPIMAYDRDICFNCFYQRLIRNTKYVEVLERLTVSNFPQSIFPLQGLSTLTSHMYSSSLLVKQLPWEWTSQLTLLQCILHSWLGFTMEQRLQPIAPVAGSLWMPGEQNWISPMPQALIVGGTQYEWVHWISMVVETADKTLCGFLHWNTTQHMLQSLISSWNEASCS